MKSRARPSGERVPESPQVLLQRRLVEADPQRPVAVVAEVDPPRARLAKDVGRPRARADAQGVEEGERPGIEAEAPQAGGEERRSGGGRGARSRGGLRARGRRRTCSPSPPAAPAPCRCCWWPCRAGCAARASAGPGAARGFRGGPWRRPPAGPGSGACARRGWRGTRRVALRSREEPRSAGSSPRRCPRRTRPAAAAGSGPGGRSPPRRARRRHGRARPGPRSPRRGRPWSGTARARRRGPAPSRRRNPRGRRGPRCRAAARASSPPRSSGDGSPRLRRTRAGRGPSRGCGTCPWPPRPRWPRRAATRSPAAAR